MTSNIVHGTRPASNRSFWLKKLRRNVARDRLVKLTLRRKGWRVLRIWEHDLKAARLAHTARRIRRVLDRQVVEL